MQSAASLAFARSVRLEASAPWSSPVVFAQEAFTSQVGLVGMGHGNGTWKHMETGYIYMCVYIYVYIYIWDFIGIQWDFIVIQWDFNGIYHLVMTNIAICIDGP